MDGVSLEGLLDNGRLRKLGGKFQLRIHLGIYHLPFNDLLFHAQTIHRANFDPNSVQLSRLLSIKTGGCPEDCGYCSQSAHYPTGLKASKLMEVERVIEEARKAKAGGATRYCLGAAWRSPKQRDLDSVIAMVQGVKALGRTKNPICSGPSVAAVEISAWRHHSNIGSIRSVPWSPPV
jgi:biotin synthase-like enzyme